jgi:DNA-binding transcriptional MerR regulator
MAVPQDAPLTLPQVAEAADVEYRTLHTWVKRGLLHPSFHASSGAGSPNLFSFRDALKARILGELRNEGIDLDLLERTAAGLDQLPDFVPDDKILVNGTVSLVRAGEDLEDAIEQARPSLVYRVSWAFEALRQVDLK